MGCSKVATSPCAGFSGAIRSILVDSTRCRRPHSFISDWSNNLKLETSTHFRRARSPNNRVLCCFGVGNGLLTVKDRMPFSRPFVALTQDAKIAKTCL